jgi:hypothetical protein
VVGVYFETTALLLWKKTFPLYSNMTVKRKLVVTSYFFYKPRNASKHVDFRKEAKA